MNRRTMAITVIAGALMAGTPALAAAQPAPDPPPRHSATGRDAALADLVAAHRTASVAEKNRIHSEITVILHHNRQGWTI
ncbi:hypothetical protein ACWEOW_00010 [Monashia sp. NPDC004114]